MTNQKTRKVLIILMQELSEVTAIGLPAIRHFQKKVPDAEIHFLTYDLGQDVIRLAEPSVIVHTLHKGEWPENILQAMEAFLGLAEQVIGEAYDQIVNFDTWFMPCFLARFLKDAGENLQGNLLSISVQQLIDQIQQQRLQTDYVHDSARYMDSSWFSMARWHTPWWEGSFLPENGYPEFYLKSCCGFEDIELDLSIDVTADVKTLAQKNAKEVVALALDSAIKSRHYAQSIELKALLNKKGYYVWDMNAHNLPLEQKLSQLKATDLLVSVPGEAQWLAMAVGCKTLLVSGDVEPKIFMPDFATDPSHESVPVLQLVQSIESVFTEE